VVVKVHLPVETLLVEMVVQAEAVRIMGEVVLVIRHLQAHRREITVVALAETLVQAEVAQVVLAQQDRITLMEVVGVLAQQIQLPDHQ
jgi:hypothetical protein